MSHPIAKALEDAAARIGRTLSKDATKAVSDMYGHVGHGTEQAVKNITAAENHTTHELLNLAEKIANNDGLTGKGSRKRIRRQADARLKIDTALGGHREYDVEMVVDGNKYRESAEHIREAQRGDNYAGAHPSGNKTHQPSILTIDTAGADGRRTESLRGIPTQPPNDRDEYPPAMFKEGGAGASVKYIPAKDNQGSGSSMGNALRGLPPGTRVKITVR